MEMDNNSATADAHANITATTITYYPRPLNVHWVATADSPEFSQLGWALTHSSLVALDAEWKPICNYHHDHHHPDHQQPPPGFPTVSLLQIACQIADLAQESSVFAAGRRGGDDDSLVFLVDLQSVPLAPMYGVLKEMFVAPDVLKLGFRFKQDLVYLSSTFCSQGCDPGFDRLEPFLDITSVYHLMQPRQSNRRTSKDAKSLATICAELLGISLSKEHQCSDWSQRPLTEEQKAYAAVDAHCLLEIFSVFKAKVDKEGNSLHDLAKLHSSSLCLGLKEILAEPTSSNTILCTNFCEASDMIRTIASESFVSFPSISKQSYPLDGSLLRVIRKYSTKILLKESDRKPKTSRKKVKKRSSLGVNAKIKSSEEVQDWQGTPPWDFSVGGDGFPKFLCDVMVEGLAKHLRCIGIDAAVPSNKRPESRELIEQAHREKRMLLTRDAKLLRHDYLIKNQIYRVKTLLKNDQLLEVIETFQLKISEDQLMSRCTKCNGRFVQRPLSKEEAVEAAKGFQKIPDCLFDKNLEFWQCTDCKQLYWEGTQYHNAVQKFIDVCKLND